MSEHNERDPKGVSSWLEKLQAAYRYSPRWAKRCEGQMYWRMMTVWAVRHLQVEARINKTQRKLDALLVAELTRKVAANWDKPKA